MPAEVEKLMKEARQGRYGDRDATLILIAFRHGLRAVKFATWNGHKLSSADLLPCTSGASRTASRPCIRSGVMKSGHCASCAGNFQIAASCLRPSGAAHSQPTPSIALSSALASVRALPSRFTVTCLGMRAATPWRMRGMTHGRCKIGLAIGQFSIPFDIPSCRRRDSRTSGETKFHWEPLESDRAAGPAQCISLGMPRIARRRRAWRFRADPSQPIASGRSSSAWVCFHRLSTHDPPASAVHQTWKLSIVP